MQTSKSPLASRREFLFTAATAAAVGPAILVPQSSYAANSDTLKIGLVGCGGRGTGAAGNALTADSNCIVTALGDAFPEAIGPSLGSLKKQFPGRADVSPENQFIGFDAYKKVIDSGVDVVLLASPPGFRPYHLRYAVEAGKQIFCEKPMATDATGIRHVMESVRMSKDKRINLVAGFCWRNDLPRRALFQQIHDGALGDVRSVYATYLTGPVKSMPPPSKRPSGMGDLEWQMRNWYNFVWLSGDGYVEQCIHSVDKLAWAMRDQPPIKCTATGGRMLPNNEGNIYDHMTVVYEYAHGTRGIIAQRQIFGCSTDNSDYILGTKGVATNGWANPTIRGETTWRYDGPKPDMYEVEHQDFFRAIRSGVTRNDGDWMSTSTLLGLMGRLAAYSGQEVTWEQAMNSTEKLSPDSFNWDMQFPIAAMAVPGKYRVG